MLDPIAPHGSQQHRFNFFRLICIEKGYFPIMVGQKIMKSLGIDVLNSVEQFCLDGVKEAMCPYSSMPCIDCVIFGGTLMSAKQSKYRNNIAQEESYMVLEKDQSEGDDSADEKSYWINHEHHCNGESHIVEDEEEN